MFCFFLSVTLILMVSAELRTPKPILDHPYLVSIHTDLMYLCSGAIISPNYVITSAQCATKFNHNYKLTIRSGSANVDIGGDTHEVTTVVYHDKYDIQGYRPIHDIAVLQVETPFKYSDKCKSVQLFEVDEKISEGTECAIAGWYGSNKEYHLTVNRAEIVNRLACERILIIMQVSDYLPVGQICALIQFNKGDSGASVVVDGRLAGIGSWGGEDLMPCIFTEIADYRDWIAEHTDVQVNFMPKISASLLLIVLVQVCIVIMNF